MRSKRIYVALATLLLLGVAMIAHVVLRQEQRQLSQELVNQGTNLVSLLALQPVQDLSGEKANFFLRTLAEYVSPSGLVYCFVHDATGVRIASLGAPDLVSKIPLEIQTVSLYSTELKTQKFPLDGSGQTIYEFAKPILESGGKSGTVRLGFRLPTPSFFSAERVRLMGTVAFFGFAMACFVYYGIVFALRRLNSVSRSLKNEWMEAPSTQKGSERAAGIDQILREFEQGLSVLRGRMKELEKSKLDLETQYGVTSFEKNQLRNILNSMRTGVIITDHQENILHINVYMLRLLDRKREEMIDHPLPEVVAQEKLPALVCHPDMEAQGGKGNAGEVNFPETSPGHVFQVSSTGLQDGEGAVVGRMIMVEDVTNERMAEKAKQEFLAHVTHELFTPLTTIRSYNEMLMVGEVTDTETQKEFYNTILEETERLQRLIQNLLSISKIEMGALTLDKSLVKCEWLVRDCIAAVEGGARKKCITIDTHLPDNLPSLVGDKELLKIALINLLGNAVKYTPEHGKITLSLTAMDNLAVFEVRDTGYGISGEDLPHIFEKFYRSKDPRIAAITGSGLGLGITSEIVHLHGGEIEVQSEPGEGTQFSLRIPREEYYLGKP